MRMLNWIAEQISANATPGILDKVAAALVMLGLVGVCVCVAGLLQRRASR